MTIAVIGRGPIGSAAARHLAQAGHEVLLIGAPEPQDKPAHQGVFASHWDEGRITRALDADRYWSDVSRASIARYAQIEAESGIPFFTESGAMMAGPAAGEFMRNVAAVQAEAAIAAETLNGAALAARFPFFAFPDSIETRLEATGAGYLNPRRMVAAQAQAARHHGAELVEATVRAIDPAPRGVTLSTEAGSHRADRVLLATGGWANDLLADPLPLAVHARTITFFALDAAEAARLAAMPALVYRTPAGDVPYVLPPIRYPDGRTYIKIGGDPDDRVLTDTEAVSDWFRSAGSAEVGAYQTRILTELMPDLRFEATHTEACVTVFTARDRPVIRRLDERMAVATGGCGRAAKCGDELGRLAAEAVLGARLPG